MKKFIFLLIIFLPILANAKNITSECNITIAGKNYSNITDDKYTTYTNYKSDDSISISCNEKVKYIYIYYNIKSSKGILNNSIKVGENGFLHELIKLDVQEDDITINYEENYSIAEIYAFSDEELPSWVENWQHLEKCDLMLFSAHADDEQLFFAGLMPTYIDKDKKIQVVYFTNHYNNTNRYHEQLEGLWAIGIKYYPIISTFPDAYSESLEGALKNLNSSGFTEDDALKYEVEQIRRFKPKVVVSHDENGEYSHGQHILTTYLIKEAIEKANDKTYDNDSYHKYGTWEINKLYLHLYPKNELILDYDIPLDAYDGKTAYEVAKLGYAKHYSQQYTWFTDWLKGPNNSYTSATQINKYNPAYYGLYYTNVGEDINHNDMFENIKEKAININLIDNTEKIISNIKEKKHNHKTIITVSCIVITFLLIIIFKKKK